MGQSASGRAHRDMCRNPAEAPRGARLSSTIAPAPTHNVQPVPMRPRFQPVESFHKFIEYAVSVSDFEAVLDELAERYRVNLDTASSTPGRVRDELWCGWRCDAPKEVLRTLDHWLAQVDGQSLRGVLRHVCERYAASLRPLVPFLVCFVRWARDSATARGLASFKFLARDGLALWAIYRGLYPESRTAGIVDLTRSMLGIAIEDTDPNSLALRPTRKSAAHRRVLESRVARGFVGAAVFDIGYYGTVVRRLIEHVEPDSLAIYLLSSKNPNLYGFTNAVLNRASLEHIDIDATTALVVTDTVEALAKPYGSPIVSSRGQGHVVLAPPQPLAVTAVALASLHAVSEEARRLAKMRLDPLAELVALDRLREVRRLGWNQPFLLDAPTPAWSHAREWIRSWGVGPQWPAGAFFQGGRGGAERQS